MSHQTPSIIQHIQWKISTKSTEKTLQNTAMIKASMNQLKKWALKTKTNINYDKNKENASTRLEREESFLSFLSCTTSETAKTGLDRRCEWGGEKGFFKESLWVDPRKKELSLKWLLKRVFLSVDLTLEFRGGKGCKSFVAEKEVAMFGVRFIKEKLMDMKMNVIGISEGVKDIRRERRKQEEGKEV